MVFISMIGNISAFFASTFVIVAKVVRKLTSVEPVWERHMLCIFRVGIF